MACAERGFSAGRGILKSNATHLENLGRDFALAGGNLSRVRGADPDLLPANGDRKPRFRQDAVLPAERGCPCLLLGDCSGSGAAGGSETCLPASSAGRGFQRPALSLFHSPGCLWFAD